MMLLSKGLLSVQPVTQQLWDFIRALEHSEADKDL